MKVNGQKMLEMKEQAAKLFFDAEAILTADDVTAEDREKAENMVKGGQDLTAQIESLLAIKGAGETLASVMDTHNPPEGPQNTKSKVFDTMGHYYSAIYAATFKGRPDLRLNPVTFTDEPDDTGETKTGWLDMEGKALDESVGASGGFLVPTEQDNTLYMVEAPPTTIRSRATIMPMRRRAIRFPVLNQTGTTSGQPHWFGGVLAQWTESGGEKDETEPSFIQEQLIAHKLVCYTEATDELLEDSAVSLEALLGEVFRGSINWYEENAFLKGSGSGQPLGVVNATATITATRDVAGAVSIKDVIRILEAFQGSNPVWMASQNILSELMELSGPTGNPSYVFMPNARDGMPATLFGYPVIFSEHCPALGSKGDLGLYDFKKYLVGDRKATTVDASKHYKFRNDITSWRAVHRVGGQPWLSKPFTYEDGSTQVSPFVVLGTTITT